MNYRMRTVSAETMQNGAQYLQLNCGHVKFDAGGKRHSARERARSVLRALVQAAGDEPAPRRARCYQCGRAMY